MMATQTRQEWLASLGQALAPLPAEETIDATWGMDRTLEEYEAGTTPTEAASVIIGMQSELHEAAQMDALARVIYL